VAWDSPPSSSPTIKLTNHKLSPQYTKSPRTTSPKLHFGELITGSENKPVYNKVARNHVTPAMEGYNSFVFACGQTASRNTFTLVSSPSSMEARNGANFLLLLDRR